MKTPSGLIRIGVIVLIVVAVQLPAEAQSCPYDTTGNWYFDDGLGRWIFEGDGVVTFDSTLPWYADDTWACYRTALDPESYASFFPQCDIDGDGLIEVDEAFGIYYRQTPIDQSYFLATAVCVEATQDGPFLFCRDEHYDRTLTDIEAIKAAYPSTQAIEDPATVASGGQGYAVFFDGILCSGFTDGAPRELFDDLNACYGGTTDCLFEDPATGRCGFLIPNFQAAVNTPKVLSEYQHLANGLGGFCELDIQFNADQSTLGFHFEVLQDWWLWSVRSTAQCGFGGCLCDKTVTVWTHTDQPGVTWENSIEDNSSAQCLDSRF